MPIDNRLFVIIYRNFDRDIVGHVSEKRWTDAIHFSTYENSYGKYRVCVKYPKDMSVNHMRKLVAKSLISQGVSRA